MAEAKVYGVDVEAIYDAAKAQPVGQQTTYYGQQLRNAFGAMELEARYSDGTAYTADFDGQMTAQAEGIALPGLGAPSINQAASGNGTIIIRSKANPGRRIEVPVGNSSPDGSRLVIAPSLNGVDRLQQALNLMLAPSGLDVGAGGGGGGGVTGDPVEMAIAMMSGWNDDEIPHVTSTNGPTWARPINVMQSQGYNTHASVVMGAEPTYANQVQWVRNQIDTAFADRKDDEWNDFLNWFVFADGASNGGHTSNNTGIRVSRYETWTRNQNTKQWSLRRRALPSNGSFAYKPYLVGDAGAINWRQPSSSYKECFIPHRNQLQSGSNSWIAHPYGQFVKIADYGSIDCIVVAVKASLIVWDTSKPDDRDDANLLMSIGADWYPQSSHELNGEWLPGCMLSRAKRITKQEQWFLAATLTSARKDYVNAAGCAISPQEFRDYPPPVGT